MTAAMIAAGAALIAGYHMRPGAQIVVGALLVSWGAIIGAVKTFL